MQSARSQKMQTGEVHPGNISKNLATVFFSIIILRFFSRWL